MERKKVIVLFSFVGVISIAIVCFLETIESRAFSEYKETSYSGVIREIRYTYMHKGSPDVNLNGEWIIVDLNDSRLFKSLSVGDSIVKLKGDGFASLYRFDSTGRYNLLIVK